MKLNGSQTELLLKFSNRDISVIAALKEARAHVRAGQQEVYPYQAAALYILAKPYNGKPVLEIGTYYGYTAYVMSLACPDSRIVTLNPTVWEAEEAAANLKDRNVVVMQWKSQDYLASFPDEMFDFIFIDGDHRKVAQDLSYWERLNDGGLMLLHDYTPLGAPRHCPPVFEAVNEFADSLRRDPDVLIVDYERVGMAGFYR